MKDFVPLLSSIAAGVFLLVAAFLAWKLKSTTEKHERAIALAKQKREELKVLYADVFVLFEQTIQKTLHRKDFALDKELSQVNAKLQLLASEKVVSKYHEVAELLQIWSRLHFKASPRTMKIGGEMVEIIQAPDPTAKFKQPASESYEKLQTAVTQLVEKMRLELNTDI